MVVKLTDGKHAVRAYVHGEAAQGLEHVLSLVTGDNDRVMGLIGDLTEEEGTTVTPADIWTVADALRHMASSLDRSRNRLETMTGGREWVNPPVAGGSTSVTETSFVELRRKYSDGMAAIIGVLSKADEKTGVELTADHAEYGPFTWLEWAVYSHHVHTHDHVGQLEAIRKALPGRS
jgi:hypothetical protein